MPQKPRSNDTLKHLGHAIQVGDRPPVRKNGRILSGLGDGRNEGPLPSNRKIRAREKVIKKNSKEKKNVR